MEGKKTWTQEECDGEANLAYLYMWYRRNSARKEGCPHVRIRFQFNREINK
jgi:hypothetical protein